jgi:hypothetical protein
VPIEEKFVIAELFEGIPIPCVRHGCPLPCLQEFATGPQPNESSSNSHKMFL